MKIYCKCCSRYLGEIRDGTLYKSIIYLCERCFIDSISQVTPTTQKEKQQGWGYKKEDSVVDEFNKIFGVQNFNF